MYNSLPLRNGHFVKNIDEIGGGAEFNGNSRFWKVEAQAKTNLDTDEGKSTTPHLFEGCEVSN